MKYSFIIQRFSYLMLFLFVSTFLSAQNLVVNPSFENTNTNCSNFGGEAFRQDLNPTWDNANTNIPGDSCSSPDLFSACNLFAVGMPSSILGWQYARTGTRYTGIILYEAPFGLKSNYREYIQGHTTSPLVAGETYCVSFYISLADAVQYASENIGVYFSNTHVARDACTDGSLLNVTPQLSNNCGVLMDTMNWVRMQWEYTASGGEQYFVIGNFKDKNNTPLHNAYGGALNPYAYYFIEDVSIVNGSCCYAEIDPISAPCVNDAPINLTASQGASCSGPTPSGTWSGPGITNPSTGMFDPNIAGVGTHTIKFTLDCGYEATNTITVKGCNLEVCEENNGDYTVSNGTGPYTWSEWSTGTTIPTTDQASCNACGGNWTFGQCLSSGFPPSTITSCTTPPGYVVFATGNTVTPSTNFPIIVVDATGDTLTINDASEVPSCTLCPPITITTSNVNPASCTGSDGTATVAASGGAGSYTYNWQPGNLSGSTQNNLSSGSYTVTATDINGCDENISITIGTTPDPSVSIGNVGNVLCNGESNGEATANATGGQSPYSYSWDNGETTATATNLNVGNHTVTVTDDNGCTSNETVTITEPNVITLSISSTDASCGSSDGSATVSASGGTGTFDYMWNDPSNQTTATANNLAGGNYEVTVTDDNGCSETANIVVNNATGPTVTIGNVSQVSCNGLSDGSATANVSGGQSPYTYSWDNGETTAAVTNLNAGDHTVTVTDDNGCVSSATVTITEPTAIVLNTSSTNATCGNNDGSASVTASGGSGSYTYQWNDPANQTTATANNLSSGTYEVTVTDGNGCSNTIAETVQNSNGPSISIVNINDASCFGADDGSAEVSVSGGTPPYTYSWTPNTSTSEIASNLSAGDYTVTVTDDAGCFNDLQITVNEPNEISIGETITVADCGQDNGTINLQVTGGDGNYTYIWSPNVSTSSLATGLASGSYDVTVTDGNGCTETGSYTVGMSGSFALDVVPDYITINEGESIDIHLFIGPSVTVDSIIWSPTTGLSCSDCTDPIAAPKETTTYYVQVIDDNGCSAMDSITITVTSPCAKIYIPTSFSPNGDGMNDLQCVMGDCIATLDFTIFNRWGEVVFQTADFTQCWDGMFRGKLVQTGVYVYKLKATLDNGDKIEESGNINVVR